MCSRMILDDAWAGRLDQCSTVVSSNLTYFVFLLISNIKIAGSFLKILFWPFNCISFCLQLMLKINNFNNLLLWVIKKIRFFSKTVRLQPGLYWNHFQLIQKLLPELEVRCFFDGLLSILKYMYVSKVLLLKYTLVKLLSVKWDNKWQIFLDLKKPSCLFLSILEI